MEKSSEGSPATTAPCAAPLAQDAVALLPPQLHRLIHAVPRGRCTLLVGPTGSGKTTLLHALRSHWGLPSLPPPFTFLVDRAVVSHPAFGAPENALSSLACAGAIRLNATIFDRSAVRGVAKLKLVQQHSSVSAQRGRLLVSSSSLQVFLNRSVSTAGLGSIPLMLRPFSSLSGGQQSRVNMALVFQESGAALDGFALGVQARTRTAAQLHCCSAATLPRSIVGGSVTKNKRKVSRWCSFVSFALSTTAEIPRALFLIAGQAGAASAHCRRWRKQADPYAQPSGRHRHLYSDGTSRYDLLPPARHGARRYLRALRRIQQSLPAMELTSSLLSASRWLQQRPPWPRRPIFLTTPHTRWSSSLATLPPPRPWSCATRCTRPTAARSSPCDWNWKRTACARRGAPRTRGTCRCAVSATAGGSLLLLLSLMASSFKVSRSS